MLDYVVRDVRCVLPTGSLRDVIEIMATGSLRHVPVVDPRGRVVGIVSDGDIRRLLLPDRGAPLEVERFLASTRAGEVMTRDPVTLSAESSMLEAVERLIEHGVGALPVVEEGRIVGLLRQEEVLRAYADQLGRTETVHIEETPPAYLERPLSSPRQTPLLFLVEPGEVLRRDLSAVLTASGVNLTSFTGLDELAEHDGLETPDLILLSARTGEEGDPLEVLRDSYPLTPVVVTREGAPRGEEEREGKGPLFLPCSAESLLARVRGEIGFHRWTHDLPVLAAPSPGQRTSSIDIDISVARQALVIEPDPLTRRILAYHLRAAGCETTEAKDAEEAERHLAAGVFDLVTLELDLPYRSGLELLERIRAPGGQAPRCVVVASARRDEDIVAAFARGVLDYIKKPLIPEVLEARLERALEL
jgi:DNA-binding response OmpR family regulator/predicted transcriptional regulator